MKGDCIRLQYLVYTSKAGLPVFMDAVCWDESYTSSYMVDPQVACANCKNYTPGIPLSVREITVVKKLVDIVAEGTEDQ